MMSQQRIDLTPVLDDMLSRFMRLRRLRSKQEAIQIAVSEGLVRALDERPTVDFRSWIGLALQTPLNPNPHFESDDDLWQQ